MRKVFAFALVLPFFLAGCGESESAKKLGQQPKQMVDKAAADVTKALQKGTDARQEAEKKN